jgi:hypothetical protein
MHELHYGAIRIRVCCEAAVGQDSRKAIVAGFPRCWKCGRIACGERLSPRLIDQFRHLPPHVCRCLNGGRQVMHVDVIAAVSLQARLPCWASHVRSQRRKPPRISCSSIRRRCLFSMNRSSIAPSAAPPLPATTAAAIAAATVPPDAMIGFPLLLRLLRCRAWPPA